MLLAHVLCEAHVGEAVAAHRRRLCAQEAAQQRRTHGELEDLAAAEPQGRAAPRDAPVDLSSEFRVKVRARVRVRVRVRARARARFRVSDAQVDYRSTSAHATTACARSSSG